MISKVTNYSPSFQHIYQIKVPRTAFKYYDPKEENYSPQLIDGEFKERIAEISGDKPKYVLFNDMISNMKAAIHCETSENNFTNADLDDDHFTYVVLTGDDRTSYLYSRYTGDYGGDIRLSDYAVIRENIPKGMPADDIPNYRNYIMRHVFKDKEIKQYTIDSLDDLAGLNLDFSI